MTKTIGMAAATFLAVCGAFAAPMQTSSTRPAVTASRSGCSALFCRAPVSAFLLDSLNQSGVKYRAKGNTRL